MPIEFRCVQCGKLLRTGDGSEGRQAQCPACETLNTVPTTPEPEPITAETLGPAQSFQPVQMHSPAEKIQIAAQRVAAPAICLIVVSSLGMVLQLLGLVVNFLMLNNDVPHNQPGMQFQGDMPVEVQVAINVGSAVLGIAFGIVVLIGAIKMKNLKSYGLSMAAAIIAMLPCISPCCVLGLPFGIWAIVVLVDPEVKAAFYSQEQVVNC